MSKFNGKRLREWVIAMRYPSVSKAVEELGCSRRAFDCWLDGKTKPPKYIALACAALHAGLPPFASKEWENDHL